MEAQKSTPDPMVDMYSGLGGATEGIEIGEECLERKADILGINHWKLAVDNYATLHPNARHKHESVDNVDPRTAVPGGRLAMLWGSPECTHHSNARGGKPRSDQSRASAWQIVRWVEALYVARIIVENVEEFRSWCPLDEDGQPIWKLKGQTYLAFLRSLRSLGYHVQERVLCCADYGDATSRERLFILAHRERKVRWPEPMYSKHGDVTLFGQMPKWRSAREIIDWHLKGSSIYGRKRPLVDGTIAWIEKGLRKYSGKPFIVQMDQGGSLHSVEDPMVTITTADAFGLVDPEPFLVEYYGTGHPLSLDDPLPTQTTKDRFGLVEPVLTTKNGHPYLDIRFRMLQPHELAAATSLLAPPIGNREDRVKLIGNAVPSYTAAALTIAQMSTNSNEMEKGLQRLFALQQERRNLALSPKTTAIPTPA